MTSWYDFEGAETEFAHRVRDLFVTHKHHTMATLRRDGSPRISGTEVDFSDGELRLGMMKGALRTLDLRRDPRIALHSQGVDPPDGDPGAWPGEAKISGRAIDADDPAVSDGSHRFRMDISEVVITRLGSPPDHLVIEWWNQARGLARRERR